MIIKVICKRIVLTLIAFLLLCETTIAQVNTESMRKGDLQPGLHANLNLDAGMVAGNSRLLQIRATLRFDYLKSTAHTFLVCSFQQGRQGQDGSLFINKGFIHLRRTNSISNAVYIEGFVQKEFNDFILLKDRNLVGGGLRIRWLEATDDEKKTAGIIIYTGTGFMWEQECVENSEDIWTNLVRSTNYIVTRWEPDERLLFQATAYFQVDVTRLSDHRVLFDGGLAFALSGKLSVSIRINARYDHDPPEGVKEYDIELTNGLTYVF